MASAAIGFFSFNDGQKEQTVACIESNPNADFAKMTARINSLVSERFGFSFYDVIFVPVNEIPRTDNRKLQMLKARKLYQEQKLKILYSSHQKHTASATAETTLIDKSLEKADEILLQVKSVFDKVLKIDQL